MKRILSVGVIALAQLGLVAVSVAPQLSARLTGDTYLVRVAPLDPIDPFRGAYAALDYPDLRHDATQDPDEVTDEDTGLGYLDDGERGDVYITLKRKGEVWVAGTWTRQRPDEGPYLACNDRSWSVRCGIESFFQPQEDAAKTEDLLRGGGIAELKIDGRGNATVIDVRAP